MAAWFVSVFAPKGCLAPWDTRPRNPAGCGRFYPTGRAGGLGVVTYSGLTDPPRRFCGVVVPQGKWVLVRAEARKPDYVTSGAHSG
jgi:hypothetical protein